MIIRKIFNNNCVQTVMDGKETIVTGPGVGFHMKAGETIDAQKIEKSFVIFDDNMAAFEKMLEQYPVLYFEITRDIAEYAATQLNETIDDKINISLTDHIAYAIERVHQGITMPSISNDMQLFFPEAYEIGLWALDYIERKIGIRLPEEEATYFTIHIVNASSSSEKYYANKSVKFLNDVMTIIASELNVTIETNSLSHRRLITHLKYLAHNIFHSNTPQTLETSDSFIKQIRASILKFNRCVDTIAKYCEKEYNYSLNADEKMYLTIHLHQVMKLKGSHDESKK
ncbi:hypothetical protein AOC36_07355 [Erysipelothrix larvae]|uniref:PRD domain-containing protein n=1 Tax=Erysipelothrix larvae TaxID=1514105 RepID=A0A0X8H0F5_9FIRM|nr:PRD domain-containing protein [Erysipelothrix larvae]AMC93805.1 hypothetical protein AOC36_07355 [Erysipelothrix larvae]